MKLKHTGEETVLLKSELSQLTVLVYNEIQTGNLEDCFVENASVTLIKHNFVANRLLDILQVPEECLVGNVSKTLIK